MAWIIIVMITDDVILNEIKVSAKKIIKNGNGRVVSETCRICKILRKGDVFSSVCEACDSD